MGKKERCGQQISVSRLRLRMDTVHALRLEPFAPSKPIVKGNGRAQGANRIERTRIEVTGEVIPKQ
jgi:hypothetical protein